MAKKITLKNKNGDVLCPHTAIEQVQGLKEALDGKLPLSGGTLTGDITAPSFKTNLASGAAEAVMAYPINYAWGTDLNSDTYLKPGMYQMSSATSPSNQPDGLTYGALVTMQGLNPGGVPTIGQIYFHQNTNGKAYIRTGTSSTILTRGWQQLAYKSDVDKAFNCLGYNLDLNNFVDSENKSGAVYINVSEGENLTNAPDRYGCAVNFGAGVSNFQLFSTAFSNKLYHRNRWWSEKGGEWKEWQQIAYKEDVDSKLGKTEKAASAAVADSATKASKLITTNWSGIDVNNCSNSEGVIEYHSMLPNTTPNIPTANGYQNAVMCFGLHHNGATAQMFFSKDSPLYYRSSQTGEWKQLRTIDDLVTTSHIADTAITPSKIQTDIALNGTPSMTVEPTTSSPDKTIASVGLVKEVMEDIEIGGRNLILNSDFSKGVSYWNPLYNASTVVFNVEDNIATFTLGVSDATVLQTSAILFEVGQEYTVSFDCISDEYTALDYCYFIGQEGQGNKSFYIYGITSEWKRIIYTFTSKISGLYRFGFGTNRNRNTAGSFQLRNVKIEKGNKATDWTPAPEDINTEISNAETRSKAHAEDYTNAEIDKIENGQTVAQKANSLYDDDSGKYKNWGEIDTAITRKIGDKFEDYATKSYVQEEISKQVAVPIASETEDGKVKLATPEDVTAVENDISAVNDSAKAVTPYTLKEYISSKNFATSGDISSAVTAAKTTIFFQVAQPAGGKDGDIWIIP